MAQKNSATTVVVGRQGRVVIPADVRRDMGIGEGDRLSVELHGGRIILVPQKEEVARIRGMFRHLGDGQVVADLIADRRRESANEPDA
jgi:antitoxin PrlF